MVDQAPIHSSIDLFGPLAATVGGISGVVLGWTAAGHIHDALEGAYQTYAFAKPLSILSDVVSCTGLSLSGGALGFTLGMAAGFT